MAEFWHFLPDFATHICTYIVVPYADEIAVVWVNQLALATSKLQISYFKSFLKRPSYTLPSLQWYLPLPYFRLSA